MQNIQMQTRGKALVLGLGVSGYSAVKYLCAEGFAVGVADTRKSPPMLAELRKHYPQVEVALGALPLEQLDRYDRVVVSPGIDSRAMQSRADIIGDIELFARACQTPLICVTGSNGKSTVATMLGDMLSADGLRCEVIGNIGAPALDRVNQSADFYVLELSSFQLETTHSLRAHAAAVLNISEDHMDRYASLNEYRAAKARIFTNAKVCVFNRNDAPSKKLPRIKDALSFGLNAPQNKNQFGLVKKQNQTWFARGDQLLDRADDMRMPGAHNAANILAAMALASAAGLTLSPRMRRAALGFAGMPHRFEMLGKWRDVCWINDSKATNVGATAAALRGFGGDAKQVVLIAGGQGKRADFAPLAAAAACVSDMILFGEDADAIARAMQVGAPQVALHRADDLRRAVACAFEIAAPGQSVLFSPACASFDMFRDFAHRGDEFKRLVRKHFAPNKLAHKLSLRAVK